ncbi:MAG: hypothetical protein ABIP49_08795 [Lysobacterales bacterium]
MMLRKWPVRRNLLDLLHGFALPLVAFVLPWRLAFATYRLMAHLPLFSTRVAMMLEGIRRTRDLDEQSARALAWRHRLYFLLETGDAALAQMRGSRWMRRYLRRVGDFPRDSNFVAVFFHFGTGLWGPHAMAEHGRPARLVGRPVDRDALRTRPFLRRYGEWRYAVAERAGRGPVIFWGGARKEIADALAAGQVVLGAVDVPPTETHSLSPVTLLGRPTHFTHGLVEIAARAQVPLVVFSVGLSEDARERVLEVSEPIAVTDRQLQEIMQELATHLDRLLERDPAGWYLWGWLDAFFAADQFADRAN